MKGLGKVVGGFLGFMLGGAGLKGFAEALNWLICGIFIGHVWDKTKLSSWNIGGSWGSNPRAQIQRIFFESTFLLMGHIAKLDGRISESEITNARLVMHRLGLNESMRLQAIRLFNQGKQPGFMLEPLLQRLSIIRYYDPILLQKFIEIQIQMALVDGVKALSKRRVLEALCQRFGLNAWHFNIFEQNFRKQRYSTGSHQHKRTHYQHSDQSRPSSAHLDLRSAYTLLGVSSQASDIEIKRAYHRLMNQYHPDKLAAKQLSEKERRLAEEKAQNINAAYNTIRSTRGMKI